MHIFTLECEQIETKWNTNYKCNAYKYAQCGNYVSIYIWPCLAKKSRFFGKLSFFAFVISDAYHNVNPTVIGQKSTGNQDISLLAPIIHYNHDYTTVIMVLTKILAGGHLAQGLSLLLSQGIEEALAVFVIWPFAQINQPKKIIIHPSQLSSKQKNNRHHHCSSLSLHLNHNHDDDHCDYHPLYEGGCSDPGVKWGELSKELTDDAK